MNFPGKLNEAASMEKEVLEKRRKILGEEHPDTISAMNKLANTFGGQEMLDKAALVKKEVLEKHPDNLAIKLGDQGQLSVVRRKDNTEFSDSNFYKFRRTKPCWYCCSLCVKYGWVPSSALQRF